MTQFRLTEKRKDLVLNILVIVSIVFFCSYFAHSSNPKKADTPNPLRYTQVTLQPVTAKQFPQYTPLAETSPPPVAKAVASNGHNSQLAVMNAKQQPSAQNSEGSTLLNTSNQKYSLDILRPVQNLLTVTKNLSLQ